MSSREIVAGMMAERNVADAGKLGGMMKAAMEGFGKFSGERARGNAAVLAAARGGMGRNR